MTTATTTTTALAALPDGYDDPSSRWYISPELRPHYRLAPPAVVRSSSRGVHPEAVRDRFASLAVKRELGNELPVSRPPRPVGGRSGPSSRAEVAAAAEYEAAVRQRDERHRQLADGMSADDEAWLYHVEKSLPAAETRRRTAEERAKQRVAYDREHTCAVCDEVERSTVYVQVNVRAGVVVRYGDRQYDQKADLHPDRSGARRIRACFACTLHLAQLVADDVVLGRPRRDVAREWLTAHLDSVDAGDRPA